MMQLFHKVSGICSKVTTEMYSTSFSTAIRLLHNDLRQPVFNIYGFVRFADEIVDTFHDQDKQALLERFKKDTYEAIESKISLNPVLHAFQLIVNEYKIDLDLIEAFLHSMAMDLDFKTYNDSKYHEYIYGSAEVVGLMCLKVFCKGDDSEYQRLREPACKLGAAFQKVNFLRDIKSDYEERGRVYFPGVDFNRFDVSVKTLIEADIQKDFDDSLIGIAGLPAGAKLGVKVAYLYYQKLFDKIKKLPPETITQQRVRIPNAKKLSLLFGSYVENKLGLS